MAHSFPTETVIRAFVLVLDHHSTEKASEYLKNFSDIEGRYPTGHTIRNWAKKGELIGIDWYKFREIADTVRMTVASDNIVRNTPKAYPGGA